MHRTTRHLVFASAAVTALALPAGAGAQQPLDAVQVIATAARADRLDARAAAYEQASDVRRFGRAARLREQAAGLRAPGDPRAFRSFDMAARLRYGLGQTRAAGDLLERAGDLAIARGDVANAAGAYVDAAFAAAEVRDPARAREFAQKATLLMGSPLLSAPERDGLLRRVAQLTPAAPGFRGDVATASRP